MGRLDKILQETPKIEKKTSKGKNRYLSRKEEVEENPGIIPDREPKEERWENTERTQVEHNENKNMTPVSPVNNINETQTSTSVNTAVGRGSRTNNSKKGILAFASDINKNKKKARANKFVLQTFTDFFDNPNVSSKKVVDHIHDAFNDAYENPDFKLDNIRLEGTIVSYDTPSSKQVVIYEDDFLKLEELSKVLLENKLKVLTAILANYYLRKQ